MCPAITSFLLFLLMPEVVLARYVMPWALRLAVTDS
jgi:hypothetical protein